MFMINPKQTANEEGGAAGAAAQERCIKMMMSGCDTMEIFFFSHAKSERGRAGRDSYQYTL